MVDLSRKTGVQLPVGGIACTKQERAAEPVQRPVRPLLVDQDTIDIEFDNRIRKTDNHVVPTVGLILSQGKASVAFTSDTGPTTEIWQAINDLDDVAAVITECSFPNRLQNVADVSLHLTPETLSAELNKLSGSQRVLLYHFKPPYVVELREQIPKTVGDHTLEELEQDRVYEF